ncbi:MAG: pantothenate kinase [Candidatus Omnitrophica bacterium CG08_land_8_20_14_0_20_41_16]|uniref:Type III pantothenate kinase n=1 Tax=Candidatus Sherwoodlollariibacterium unditelluris TaxID=1974757 RepID=A0A2G9YIG1_9BACT|nr:MAG: pantothenate kinase [Candidatus Omnitrophica bacterium CG23_combo_of_CG06-09_8_20_14_all_41_10]PIS34178.1 MAG: pantothenate kinase [Candidatus Omnitrophica bacterium CG08_land_8_20_14_0_20_41_16]
MLLAIDIGNTNISFGLSRGSRIIRTFNIPTQQYTLNKLKAKLGKIVPNDAIICSVVPKRTGLLSQNLKTLSGRKPYIIGKDIIVPIKNLYRDPKQAGQDRLVNAYTASKLYGTPLIAIDFGTAITFDVISKKGEYLGGMILPGLSMSLEALNQRTALLPRIKLERPNDFIGKDTKNSMLSGIIYGFSSLTDELIMRIRKAVGQTSVAAATGGNINLISKYCRRIDKIDKNLTLKGLNMLYLHLVPILSGAKPIANT